MQTQQQLTQHTNDYGLLSIFEARLIPFWFWLVSHKSLNKSPPMYACGLLQVWAQYLRIQRPILY